MNIVRLVYIIVFSASFNNLAASDEMTNDCLVDFRYSPQWWQTSICLPDDWQKTLVGKDGSLLYEYPGSFSGFGLKIVTTNSGPTEWLEQRLYSAKVPIIITELKQDSLDIKQTAFAVAPVLKPLKKNKEKFVIERLDSNSVIQNWAKPPQNYDQQFKNVAVGWGRPVHYRLKSEKGKTYWVAFGLCEGWHTNAGKRIIELKLEGETKAVVDPVKQNGQNIPAVYIFSAADKNDDGWIDIISTTAETSPDTNSILNLLWIFPAETFPSEKELLTGVYHNQPIARINCGSEEKSGKPPRHDVVIVRYYNKGNVPVRINPQINIYYPEAPAFLKDSRKKLIITHGTELVLTEDCVDIYSPNKNLNILQLPEVIISPNKEYKFSYCVIRGNDGISIPKNVREAERYLNRAIAFWEKLDLPYDKIQVPDDKINAIFNSCVRNIYQAREIKNGLPAFQVGPTCYRGLWVVDGSFIMEAISFLGRTNEARQGIRYLMNFQREDGGIMLIDGHWKETGIALWAIFRHAQLTCDKKWLESNWNKVELAVNYITRLRKVPQKGSPNEGLIPDGFSDGGLSGKVPEYTNIYWTLAGWKAAIAAAIWLGKNDTAEKWQNEYNDFYYTFKKAAERDLKTDRFGNKYLPIRMKYEPMIPPQKAQWAFLHSVFPGKVFEKNDELVSGNMAMLGSVEKEGLIFDTGWLKDGIWTYCGSFYGHSLLWLGQGEKAAKTLIAFANHSSPLMVWREEQMPAGKGENYVGDMPHNWASAEFIRLLRNCLVLERENELHLLEGFPQCWIKPGASIKVNKILTEFGEISFEMRFSQNGKSCEIKLNPPRRNPPNKILIHTEALTGKNELLEATVYKNSNIKIPIESF
ncbi:MAG: hypothetical protein ACP5MG_06305 [Verrucomicrobiia bacterium]